METYENEISLSYGDKAALNILLLNENSIAEIIDFSERGATCRVFTSSAAREFEEHGVDLFNCLAGQHLKGLPCKVIYSVRQTIGAGSEDHKTIYQVEFPDLSDDQKRALNQFIEDGYQHFALHDSATH